MARDGSGTFTRDGVAASTGATISASNYNTDINGIASALTASIAKDGQTTPTANLPMGGYKHTGVASASGASRTEYVSGGVAQDGGVHWCGTAGGTGNAITLTPTPAITSYAAGQVFRFIAGSSNTSIVTVAVSGLSVKAVQKGGGPLASGDIGIGKTYELLYNGTAFQMSPYDRTIATAGSGIAVSGTDVSIDINGLTEDTAPDLAADFVATYDVSGTANKKVKLNLLSRVVQEVAASTASRVTCSTLIPLDDTIPQSGEGNEVITVAITPTNSANTLEIEAVVFGYATPASSIPIGALFKDSDANAIAAATLAGVSGDVSYFSGTLFHRQTAGSTSAQTFKLRVGGSSGTVYVNGNNTARLFGGVGFTYISVREILA